MSYHITQFKFQDDATVRQLTELMEEARRRPEWQGVFENSYQSLIRLLRAELGHTVANTVLVRVVFGQGVSFMHDLELAVSMVIDDCEIGRMFQ